MGFVDQRADGAGIVERITGDDACRQSLDLFQKLVGDRLVNNQATTGNADLTRAMKGAA